MHRLRLQTHSAIEVEYNPPSLKPFPPSCLDNLPNSAVRNVVRHLSSSPTKPNWQEFVAGTDALSIVQLSRSVADEAASLFTHVSIGRQESRTADIDLEHGKGILSLDNSFYDLSKRIRYVGASLVGLSIGNKVPTGFFENFKVMLGALKTKRQALRCLDLGGLYDKRSNATVLNALHGRLHKLIVRARHESRLEKH